MKTIKEWTKQHLVTSWAIASGVFAVLIHILYAIPAPCDFLENKWGAGDILTYVSTVALGLLAVWQNQRFKEEGDKAQADAEIQHENAQNELRQIIRHNNEINTISHITDVELQYINRVEQSCTSIRPTIPATTSSTGTTSPPPLPIIRSRWVCSMKRTTASSKIPTPTADSIPIGVP